MRAPVQLKVPLSWRNVQASQIVSGVLTKHLEMWSALGSVGARETVIINYYRHVWGIVLLRSAMVIAYDAGIAEKVRWRRCNSFTV